MTYKSSVSQKTHESINDAFLGSDIGSSQCVSGSTTPQSAEERVEC